MVAGPSSIDHSTAAICRSGTQPSGTAVWPHSSEKVRLACSFPVGCKPCVACGLRQAAPPLVWPCVYGRITASITRRSKWYVELLLVPKKKKKTPTHCCKYRGKGAPVYAKNYHYQPETASAKSFGGTRCETLYFANWTTSCLYVI